MTTTLFRPAAAGGWLAFVARSGLLVLPADPGETVIRTLWSALDADGGFQAVLDVLTSRGLSATPTFLLVQRDDEAARIVVRGEIPVRYVDAAGEQQLTGAGVSTWNERAIRGLDSLAVEVPGATPAAPELPFVAGVVWAGSISIAWSAESAPAVATPAKLEPAVAEATPEPVLPSEISEATVTDAPAPPTPAGGVDVFGATVVRSAVTAEKDTPADEPDLSTTQVPELEGDHDGHTIMTSDLAAMRAARRPAAAPEVTPVAPPTIYLELSGGAREPLTQPILVGRAPSVSKVSGGQMPRLVTVGGVDQDISRNHAQFVLEGDTVVVTDLHSRNGTLVRFPGKDAQKLRPGEPTAVIIGTVVDLGSGITMTVGQD